MEGGFYVEILYLEDAGRVPDPQLFITGCYQACLANGSDCGFIRFASFRDQNQACLLGKFNMKLLAYRISNTFQNIKRNG